MDQLYNFFIGSTAANYVEAGFSEREAEAMTWIANQKPMGKFYGFLSGSFMAAAWGHWHNRIFAHFGIKCNRIYTQLFILGVQSALSTGIHQSRRLLDLLAALRCQRAVREPALPQQQSIHCQPAIPRVRIH